MFVSFRIPAPRAISIAMRAPPPLDLWTHIHHSRTHPTTRHLFCICHLASSLHSLLLTPGCSHPFIPQPKAPVSMLLTIIGLEKAAPVYASGFLSSWPLSADSQKCSTTKATSVQSPGSSPLLGQVISSWCSSSLTAQQIPVWLIALPMWHQGLLSIHADFSFTPLKVL